MTRFTRTPVVCAAAALLATALAGRPAANGAATRLLRSPTVSATQIAFVYANNIWVVESAGGNARRLTSFQGADDEPEVFSRRHDDRVQRRLRRQPDVYVVPADGGEPTRLTWHPGADTVQGWTPDGKSVMFASSRATAAPSAAPRFWTVPANGGVEEPLPLPRGYQGKISPDGRHIAYRMNNSWDDERRNYRGGQNRPIWIVDLKTFDLVSPPWTDSKDIDPVWVGDIVYFISDRDGVANVWWLRTPPPRRWRRKPSSWTSTSRRSMRAAARWSSSRPASSTSSIRIRQRQATLSITATGDFPWMMPRWEDVTARMTNIGALADRQARRRRSARRDLHDSRRER